MSTTSHSPETSPTGSELEKSEMGRGHGSSNEVREEVEEQIEEDGRESRAIRQPNVFFHPPLQQIRSHSSARSRRSYTDGYMHFEHDDDEEKQERSTGPKPEEGKEFEVTFDGDSDPINPKSKTTLRKWSIVLIGSACSLCVTCASALYTSTYQQMEREFGISREVATVGLTTYVCGLGLGPMALSPLSEFFGRRQIYLWAFGMFFIWLIPCAVAQNVQTMLIVRFFDGLAGSAFLSVAGGTVGDCFNRQQLSMPMLVYTASPFVGPEIGPVIGGFINQFSNWRWSFWVLVIWAGVLWLMILIFVPETYAPVLLRRKAIELRKETGDDRWQAPIEKMKKSVAKTVLWSCIRPFQLLMLEQMCLNLCLLSAILLGILYLFFGARVVHPRHVLAWHADSQYRHSQLYSRITTDSTNGRQVSGLLKPEPGRIACILPDNPHTRVAGLTFLGIFVGMVIGVACDPLWRRNCTQVSHVDTMTNETDIMVDARLVRNNGNVSEPEFRLPPTIVSVVPSFGPIAVSVPGWNLEMLSDARLVKITDTCDSRGAAIVPISLFGELLEGGLKRWVVDPTSLLMHDSRQALDGLFVHVWP